MIHNHTSIPALEKRYRANLINSLGGFKSLVLIGTRHESGAENLATFSSLFHLGADPALCGIIVRPTQPGINTLHNIQQQKQYTINHVRPAFYREAHQCSANYLPGESVFEAIPIELNDTTLVIGRIIYVEVPDEWVGADGFIDLEKANTVTCSGLDSYHTTSRLARLSYAKPDRPVTEIH